MSFGCSGPLVPATASVADVTDSNLMTTQYIALASGTVCETRLQHITKLFTHVQPSSRATQEVQLQQAKKERHPRHPENKRLALKPLWLYRNFKAKTVRQLRQSSMSANTCLQTHLKTSWSSGVFASAPCARSSFTMATWPSCAAWIRPVSPYRAHIAL